MCWFMSLGKAEGHNDPGALTSDHLAQVGRWLIPKEWFCQIWRDSPDMFLKYYIQKNVTETC